MEDSRLQQDLFAEAETILFRRDEQAKVGIAELSREGHEGSYASNDSSTSTHCNSAHESKRVIRILKQQGDHVDDERDIHHVFDLQLRAFHLCKHRVQPVQQAEDALNIVK